MKRGIAILSLVVLLLCSWGCAKRPLTPVQQVQAAFDAGNWAATIEKATPLLGQDPTSIPLLTYRGKSFLALGDYTAAVRDFSQIIELNPQDAEGYYLRQLAYSRSDQHELADLDGQRARSLDPNYIKAHAYARRSYVNEMPDNIPADAQEAESIADRAKTNASDGDSDSDSNDFATNAAIDGEGQTTDANSQRVFSHRDSAVDATADGAPESPAAIAGSSAKLPVPTKPTSPANPSGPAVPTDDVQQPDDAGDTQLADDAMKQEKETDEQQAANDNKKLKHDADELPLDLPPVLPPLSTALPQGPNGTIGGITSAPGYSSSKTTGINSRANLPGIPTTNPEAGFQTRVPTTGIQSFRPPVSNGATGLPHTPSHRNWQPPSQSGVSTTPNLGASPGQYLGSPIHTPGSKPILSTSLPGSGPANRPGLSNSGPGLKPGQPNRFGINRSVLSGQSVQGVTSAQPNASMQHPGSYMGNSPARTGPLSTQLPPERSVSPPSSTSPIRINWP